MTRAVEITSFYDLRINLIITSLGLQETNSGITLQLQEINNTHKKEITDAS